MTTTLLLDQLGESGNQTAWRELDARFRGIVLGAARKLGLDEADAADVAQETMVQSFRDFQAGRYDRSRGRLSGWIISIARHRISDVLRRRQQASGDLGESGLINVPAVEVLSKAWEEALHDEICRRAWEHLQSTGGIGAEKLKAFELVVIRGVPPAVAAVECGIPIEQVYVAKNRVAGKLREIVERMSRAIEDGL